MHETWLSPSAQRTFDRLSGQLQAEFSEICDYIVSSLSLLFVSGFVYESFLYGEPYFRYWDSTFPFMIYFRLGRMGETDPRAVLEVHLVLPAEPTPPTQARI